MENKIRIFENKQVRALWNPKEEEWYFSVVDVVGILSNSDDPNNYWKVLKNRLKKEGSELVTSCNRLKMVSPKVIVVLSSFTKFILCITFSSGLKS